MRNGRIKKQMKVINAPCRGNSSRGRRLSAVYIKKSMNRVDIYGRKKVNMKEQKEYEALRFTDDFMFCKIMTTRLDICKEVLELILGIRIKEVKLTEAQKSINITAEGKGIRLDVYVDDENDTVYDIEMQTTYQSDIAKRSRYYQGMIDLNLIEKGALYKDLRKSYIIFICLNKPFADDANDLPIYTFKNMCEENKSIILPDETTKVFLNVASNRSDIPGPINEFFDYLKGHAPANELCRKINESVENAVKHEEWRDDYMTLQMRDRLNYLEGHAEGLAESRKNDIERMLRSGKSPEQIAEFCGYDLKEVQEVQEQMLVKQ